MDIAQMPAATQRFERTCFGSTMILISTAPRWCQFGQEMSLAAARESDGRDDAISRYSG
jgi:hypothetical protein